MRNEIDATGERADFFETVMGQHVDGELYSSVWGEIHALSEDRSQCKKRLLDIMRVTQALGKTISWGSADAAVAMELATRAQSSVSS